MQIKFSRSMPSLVQRQLAVSLRKNFDSFTSQHKLRDAKEDFAQAMYRFRAAEAANAQNLIALKREMDFLGRKLEYYRQCIYTGQSIEGYAEWSEIPERCPIPAWTSK